uniref:Secreted protein n=1 Tax=Mesocestoides corti TaxID=53468 RepID=A0A5K3G5G8_MESCO
KRQLQQNRLYRPIRSQNHKSSALHRSPRHWPRRSLYTANQSCPSLVGCLSSSHAIGTQRHRIGCGQVVQHVCALIRRPKPRVRRLSSESTTLATPPIIYCTSVVSFSGWLPLFLACHWNAEGHRIGCGQVVQHVCALIRSCTASSLGVKLSSVSGLVHRTVHEWQNIQFDTPRTPHLAG